MDEFELINKYFRPLSNNSKEAQNLNDDVALICDDKIVVSKDLMIQDVHFKLSDGPYNIANRLIRSNLSDIAASGSKPLYYMLGFHKNKHVDESFLNDFTLALKEINQDFNISLIGGDTVKSNDRLVFSVTIFGQAHNSILSRKNACDKQLIFTSGYIGDALIGRKILEKGLRYNEDDKQYLVSRYNKPSPRIDVGEGLIKRSLSQSAIDISDGLFADLKHICQSSNLKATIFKDKIPLSSQARNIVNLNKDLSILDLCSGGDDYELIFCVDHLNLEKINILSKDLNIPLTNIGYLERKNKDDKFIKLLDGKNEIEINKFGYEH
jgi:thiamine-monophosphate kinase